jgi:periplasmic copper chaperone A
MSPVPPVPTRSTMHPPSPRPRLRPVRTLVVGLTTAVVALLALNGPAAAHVSSSEEPVASGDRVPVTFTFDHGCAGQPTTYLRVQIPDGVRDVQAEDPAGWTSTVTADEVRWDGGSVPDGETVPFVATMVVDAPEGTVVHFPTIQGCPTAEEAWIQIPDASNPEPEFPAPSITIGSVSTASIAPEPAAAAPSTAAPPTTRPPLEDSPIASREVERSSAGLIVFIAVTAIILGGALILYLRHRGTGRTPPV